MTDIYYNPLGKKYTTQELTTSDIGVSSFKINDTSLIQGGDSGDIIVGPTDNEKIYSGDAIKKMRNSNLIINAMLDDSRIQNKSNDLYLAILSSVTGISIIVFMILLRNINTK